MDDKPLDQDLDPDLQLEALRSMAMEATTDLTPILIEKAINGKTKDALAIWEAFADRTGFHKPPTNQPTQGTNILNLSINPDALGQMLGGLKQITENQPSPEQTEHSARSAEVAPSGLPSSKSDIQGEYSDVE